MSSYATLRSGDSASSKKLVDPYGGDLTAILEGHKSLEDAVKHGVSTTRTGNIRAEDIAAMANYLAFRERPPTNAAGLIALDAAFAARNHRTRSHLEKKGIPASGIPRLLPPLNDGTIARTTNGLVADFTTAEYLRSVAAINSLNETQFAVVNNDIAATVKGIFDTSQILSDSELEYTASGLVLLANIRMQVLSVAIRSTRYTDQILDGMEKPRTTHKEFQDMMALVSNAIRREALVNRQPWNWVSDDTFRRITAELGDAPDALPDNLSRLRGRLIDASIQVDNYQAKGNLTFDDLRTIYAEAYREAAGRTAAAAGAGSSAGAGGAAEVVYTAQESSRGNRRNKGRTSMAATATAKKGSWSRPQGGQRYYSPGGKKGPLEPDARKTARRDNRKYDSCSPDQDSETKSLRAEVKRLKAQLAEQSARGTKRPGALLAQEGSDSDEELHALAAVHVLPKKARRTWNKVTARAFMAMELAPDNSEALHSEVDVPNYVFPEEDSQGEPDPPDDAPVMNRLGFVAGTDEFLAKLNQDIQPVPKTQESVALRRRHVFETIGRIYDVASLLDRERYSPSCYNFVMVPGEDRYKDSDYFYKLGMTEPPCARKEEPTIGRHQDKEFHHRDSGQESYSEQVDSSGDEVEDEKVITP